MKSVVLTPYCPWPVNTGAKVEMQKHIEILRSLGDCTIVSAATRPVGMGWDADIRKKIEQSGYHVILREDMIKSLSWKQWVGIWFAVVCKTLKFERAFSHANPYHRHAFSPTWWKQITCSSDIAIINYSYWAWLPATCPKIIILHDLFSKVMWGGGEKEITDLMTADLVVVISKDEEQELKRRGIRNILWSPPLVKKSSFPLTERIGIVGSANLHNREGLEWLGREQPAKSLNLTVYGSLAEFAMLVDVQKIDSYLDGEQPYKECGVMLLPTSMGTGVQIKAVEALASGRAIIARRGAMRGLPQSKSAWIEVDTPSEMWLQAERFCLDEELRRWQGDMAHNYYMKHLDYQKNFIMLQQAYLTLYDRRKLSAGSSN